MQKGLTQYARPWNSLEEGDGGCIGPVVRCCVYEKTKKIYSTFMTTFYVCLTVGRLFISLFSRAPWLDNSRERQLVKVEIKPYLN